jgi:PAS domain S-box-containing protein
VSKASGTPAVGVDLPLEAEPHLRAVLESQPFALTRLARDGTVLAVNQAGLSMLGAAGLEQVLGTSFLNLVQAEEHKGCHAFIERALSGQRGSFEADLIGLTGSRHTFELHATAHPGAPDGIASVLISFRDVTESRRLEQSLVEAAARQAEQDATHETERARLLADLDLARKAQHDQLAADEQLTELERRLADLQEERAAAQRAHDAEVQRLQDALAEQRSQSDLQAAAVARLGGSDQQLTELRGRYESLEAERQQLLEMAGLLRSEAEARQQTLFELTERLEGLEAERQHAVDSANALRLNLDERHVVVADLTERLSRLEGEQQQAAEASAQLQRELDSRTSLANELAARIEQLEAEQSLLREGAEAEQKALREAAEAELAALRESADAEIAEARSALEAEQSRHTASFEQEQAAIRAQAEARTQELQARYDTDTGALRDALNEAMTEQARLAEAMRIAEEEAAEKAARLAAVEQSLNDERTAHAARLVELEANAATRLAEVEIRAAESERAGQAHIAEIEGAQVSRTAELEAALTARDAERESAEADAAARTAERDAIHAAQIAGLEAAHAARIGELEAALAEAAERAEAALAAVQRAEEAFGAERQRLEEALVAAVDAEKAARQALSAEVATRAVAERGHRQMQAAIERFAREAGITLQDGGAEPAAAKSTTTNKVLAERLGAELPRRLGDGLDLSLLPAGAETTIAMDEESAAQAIGVFADSRRASMLSGSVAVEIAEVVIDEGVGHARGMGPGGYVLVALNVNGPGAQQGIPQEVFDSADPRAWRLVKDDLQAARATIVAAGGQVWLTREGASIMIVEFYLPREGTR